MLLTTLLPGLPNPADFKSKERSEYFLTKGGKIMQRWLKPAAVIVAVFHIGSTAGEY